MIQKSGPQSGQNGYEPETTPPPSFEEGKNRRQKARVAGMNPDYWYAVAHSHEIAPGKVIEVKFWKKSYAVYRGDDGTLRAVEDRCAHRQVKLSLGEVRGCDSVCTYHGWCYGEGGKLVDVPHEMFGKKLPNVRIGSYPVKEKYNLIWVFFGDPALSETRHIPEIPELDGRGGPTGHDTWACAPVDFLLKCHHSMLIENICDFTHAYLHRKTKPFVGSKLTKLEAVGDRVHVSYETQVGMGRVTSLMVDRKRVNTNAMDLCYEYPYQWSNTDDKIKSWCFALPIDERTTRAFFLFYFESLKLPFLPIRIPRRLMDVVLGIAKQLYIKPVLVEDGVAVESEQQGFEAYHSAPFVELNPVMGLFQQLTIRKWEEHLGVSSDEKSPAPVPVTRLETLS